MSDGPHMSAGPQPELDTARYARLVEASRILNATNEQGALLDFIIGEAAALTGAEAASILLFDHETRRLRFCATSDRTHDALFNVDVPLDNSVAGTVFRNNEPLIIDRVAQDGRWNPEVDVAVGFQTVSILGVPMHDASLELVGVLEAINKRGGNFDKTDVETLTTLADLAGVAVARARLVEALRRANRQLSELDQLKSKFIAIASHELRTPLSIILAYVSTLREEARHPQTADQLDRVLRAAVRLRSLIQDMLNLQYVESGDPRLTLEAFDLVDFVRDAVSGRDETAEAKRQTIRLELPDAPLVVCADRGAMDAVVGNLLSNAIKFTPPRGEITVRVEDHGDEAWLRVRDAGGGIPDQELDRIFDRFYQVESPLQRSHEGLGLGLVVARDLLEAQDGRIWVRSEVGKGSEFIAAVPVAVSRRNGEQVAA